VEATCTDPSVDVASVGLSSIPSGSQARRTVALLPFRVCLYVVILQFSVDHPRARSDFVSMTCCGFHSIFINKFDTSRLDIVYFSV
jgi:hypothetical protein